MVDSKVRLGVTGSQVGDLGGNGALAPILTQLGGAKGGQMAMDYARQMYPDAPEADPWEAALQFFLEMGRGASQPGATVLGSAVGAAQAPVDYLNAKKKEKTETDRARMQTALQLAPSLKPKGGTYKDPKEYSISMPIKDADGKITGYETAYTDFLTAKDFAKLQAEGARFTSVPKASKFTKRTLYKNDGSTIDVYDQESYDKAISSGFGRTKLDDFNPVTLYKEDGSSIVVRSKKELDSLTGEKGGEWKREKPAPKSTAQFKRTVYKNGQELTVYSQAEYDEAVNKKSGWSPKKPAPAGPQGSAPERATNRVLDFVDAFKLNPAVDPRSFAQFLSDVRLMSKPQIISFKDAEGNMQSASTPGVDAYKFISEAYGPEVANAIKALSKGQPEIVAQDGTGDGSGDEDQKTKDNVQKVIVAGKEFTVFSSTPASMPKEASDAIVNAAGALKDINIAYDLLFPNGKLNRGALVAANFLPNGGFNLTKADTDSRTAYQSMRRVIELILRARTGATAPESEVQNYIKLYFPSPIDNDEQARNKLITLAQYFTDTTRILSQGRLLYDPTTPVAERKFLPNKHGIPLSDAASQAANEAPDVVTVTSEWTLDGVKYKQLSDGRIITEEAE